jgi:soluble lytic murein transglycosylase-like protein
MRNRLHAITTAARLAATAILLSGIAWAQDVSEIHSPDLFQSWQASLDSAADRALAAALADKPWMTAPEVTRDGGTVVPALEPAVRVRAAVRRVQQLRPLIEPILRQEGVPADLSAVVLVESGGQPAVISPKGARGAWQFMPDTARRYGLTVATGLDERVDLEKSTRAAARYLRDLYRQFGNWQLALAAYNAGEQTVQRALERTKENSFARMSRVLPEETRRYVPAVLSAMALFGSGALLVDAAPVSRDGVVIYAPAGARP